MSNLADVIEKIQKLLRVASSSDKAGEVAAAQLLAQQLITKYQIEEAQLHGSSVNGDIISINVPVPSPYANDKATLLNSIALPNFCKVLQGDGFCLIFGYASDVNLCIALYELLVVHMVSEMSIKLKAEKASHSGKFPTREWIKSFFGGYAINIGLRIKQAKKDIIDGIDNQGKSLALVLRDKEHAIEDYWQNLVRGGGSKRKLGSLSGYNAGKKSAANADLKQSKLK